MRNWQPICIALLCALGLAAPVTARGQSASETLEQLIKQKRDELGCKAAEDLTECQLRVNLERLSQLREAAAKRRDEKDSSAPQAGLRGPVFYDANELRRWAAGSSRTVALFCSHQFGKQSECEAAARSCVAIPAAEVAAAMKKVASWSAAPAC